MKDKATNHTNWTIQTSNLVYSKTTNAEGNEVLLQTLKNTNPTLDELLALKNDFEISKNLQIDGALKSRELIQKSNTIVVVKDYFNGTTLSEYLKTNKLSIQQFLEIAIKLTNIIRQIHENKIIHKDIRPDNFLISGNGDKICIANFGIATQLFQEQQEQRLQDILKESLTHISPEQTGRMNRSLDYRSDFYSLGVLFYQILCNRLPFEYNETIEIIHAHIARYPKAPKEINPAIPEAISAIVMKLLSKNAEERYQSSVGLNFDLAQCLTQWKQNQSIDNFQIASNDFSPVLNISEKLYGRENELKILIDAFNRTIDNPPELVLIGGYSGIGKTRMINEIIKPVASKNGFFASGKFDQYDKDRPYSAFSEAVGSVIKQLLRENNEQIGNWKNKLTDSFENNGQVLIEVFPELELLIGKQNQVLKLGLNETNQRFMNLFQKLLTIFAENGQPLVLFLDDLQWADSGSFELIQETIANRDLKNILIIGAYRNNETPASHPLMLMLDNLNKKVSSKTETLKLSELNRNEVNQFIADTFRMEAVKVSGLTDLVVKKTGGNPYFIIQFIKKLVEENFISFNNESNQWIWNEDAISGMTVTENVVDLLVTKIQKFSAEAKEILKLAACIGNSFDTKTILLISDRTEQNTFEILWDLVQEGVIAPKNKWNKHAKDELFKAYRIEGNQLYDFFKFQHDRIQQAAYSIISDADKHEIHYKIGMLLLRKYKNSPQNKLLFELLNHLNFASESIHSEEDKTAIAELNLMAGEKAKQSNAYQPALNHLKAGMDLLMENQASELFKKLLLARSETEYLCGHYQNSEQLFDQAIEKTDSKIEKAAILAAKMSLYENTNRQIEAIKIAIEGLAIVGIKLPEKPGTVSILKELLKAKMYLRNKPIDVLKENKEMDSAELLIAMKILVNLWGPAYLFNQNLLALAILKMVILSTRYGNSPESALAYAFYGFVSCAQLKEYEKGLEFAQLGIWLNEKFEDTSLRSKVYVIYAGCVAFWSVKRSELLPTLSKAHLVGVESNDLIYAGYAFSFYGKTNFFMGTNLIENREEVDKFIQFSDQIQYPLNLNYMKTLGRVHYDLTGKTPNVSVFSDAVDLNHHLTEMEALAKKDGTALFLATHHIYQGMAKYFLNEYDIALEELQNSKKYLEAVLGLEDQITYKLYSALTICAVQFNGKPISFAKKLFVKKVIAEYKKLALLCPENYQAQYLILKAEWLSLNNKNKNAELTYSQARISAKENGMNHMLALALERSAKHYLRLHLTDIANNLLLESYKYYGEWGALAKLKLLESEFSNLDFGISGLELKLDNPKKNTRVHTSKNLDLQSIFKASTTISGEIIFEKLLNKLLKIIIENAGAQRVYLMMVADGVLKAEAFAGANQSVKILNGIPIEEVNDVAKSMIQLVHNTGETIIINDAIKDTQFAHDEYIKQQKTKSILVLPIKQHAKILAILYLENNIASGAFTPERLELLNLLSGQIAISLENSSLYENLEQKVRERTKIIESQKEEIEAEKEKSEKLLLNILPTETAEELKQTGSYKPRKYDSVTIIFTDFEGFTKISEKLTTEELVEMIDHCYKGFDRITSKYQIEKIKTIGDAYMCVSGLPIANTNHAINAIYAAIEMHQFINEYNAERRSKGLPYCPLRIGMHSGPVAAGVVGSKKFAYDIWGDSVNIASRLESAAEIGRINISSSTYEIIKHNIVCIHRGKIAIKNKEDIDMYFVNENILPEFSGEYIANLQQQNN